MTSICPVHPSVMAQYGISISQRTYTDILYQGVVWSYFPCNYFNGVQKYGNQTSQGGQNLPAKVYNPASLIFEPMWRVNEQLPFTASRR